MKPATEQKLENGIMSGEYGYGKNEMAFLVQKWKVAEPQNSKGTNGALNTQQNMCAISRALLLHFIREYAYYLQ